MAGDLIVKGVAFLALAGVVVGSTIAVRGYLGTQDIELRGLVVEAVEPRLVAEPGSDLALGVVVRNSGATVEDVALSLDGAWAHAARNATSLRVPADGAAGGWIDLRVPAATPRGTVEVVVTAATVRAPVREASTRITLIVGADGDAVAPGGSARILFLGRLDDGRVFRTNVRAYDEAPFPRTADYSTTALVTVDVDDENVPEGLRAGLVGMREGETRTLFVPGEKGFPTTLRETVEATLVANRRETIPVTPANLTREEFAGLIEATHQGRPEDYRAGSFFQSAPDENGNALRYRVIDATPARITFVPAPEVGDVLTRALRGTGDVRGLDVPYAIRWTNASRVARADARGIVIETTPPATGPDAPITVYPFWPAMSYVEEVTDSTIVIRHAPPEGTTYDFVLSREGPAWPFTVTRLGGDVIHQEYRSPSPLAGRPVVFHVRVVDAIPAEG